MENIERLALQQVQTKLKEAKAPLYKLLADLRGTITTEQAATLEKATNDLHVVANDLFSVVNPK